MDLQLCPEHVKSLVATKTKYGTRNSCPVAGCTVACWDGSTSTPADEETRQARMDAHNAFDRLWKSGAFSRKKAYRKLAEFMGLKAEKTHIGLFNKYQARAVIEFCKEI